MENAFVLMRVYNPFVGNDFSTNPLGTSVEKDFFERLGGALSSLDDKKCNLVICDDTPKNDSGKWGKHRAELIGNLNKNGFNIESHNLFFTDTNGGEGSAMAEWRLRKHFLKLSKNIDGAFAVLLDQDDKLYRNALTNIESVMQDNGIVISAFNIAGEMERDITADGGSVHNSIVMMSDSCFIQNRIHRLSTIGWTKAYSKGAMAIMVADFEDYFKNTEQSAEEFFIKYRAYEDFLDFYMLLNNKIKVCFNKTKTHIYYKHGNSITAAYDLVAFRTYRATMLVTLSKMCCTNKDCLRSDWEELLVNFLYVKISDIERILRKNRENKIKKVTDGENKKCCEHLIETQTWDGWFVYCNDCRALDDYYFRKASEKWIEKMSKKQSRNGNTDNKKKTNKHKSPMQRLLCKSRKTLWIGAVAIIITCIFCLILAVFDIQSILSQTSGALIFRSTIDFSAIIDILRIFLPLWVTLYTVMCQINNHLRVKLEEEKSQIKLYSSEFDDLIRHIDANLRVMIQIELTLFKSKDEIVPSDIHFENLKWPEASSLFLDDMAKLIDKSQVDDFVRLRLNIRNMNNSAQWLKNYCNSKEYSKSKFREMLDWEISRTIAYYLNFLYVKEHDFTFPSPEQLRQYCSQCDVREKLYSLFMGVDKISAVESTQYYLTMYQEDRSKQRRVIFHNISKCVYWS